MSKQVYNIQKQQTLNYTNPETKTWKWFHFGLGQSHIITVKTLAPFSG